MDIAVKRVYDAPEALDGVRILVDRLWPRGLAKSTAKLDLWLKTVAPSDALRKWYQHDPEKWPEFQERYFAELDANGEAIAELLQHIKKGRTTLLYSTKEAHFNNAVALVNYLGKHGKI